VFDEATRRAVASFQRSQILPTTGAVGPLTRRRLEVPYGAEGRLAAAAEAAGRPNAMSGASSSDGPD
jgi:peptidoglycan hydrolase-like protein with peptidoglycan-binding domain